MLVADVVKMAQGLLNDVKGTNFTTEALLPHINTAMAELQEEFEINNVPVTDSVTSDPIEIPEGETEIAFFVDAPHPRLPDNFVEPQLLWQRQAGIDPWIPMVCVQRLPQEWDGIEVNQLLNYVWKEQKIKFLPANCDMEVKIEYVKHLFRPLIDANAKIDIINSLTFLGYRSAGLAARFIGENPERADSLDTMAILGMNRALGISAKGRQKIAVRRRPFMASYKRRGYLR